MGQPPNLYPATHPECTRACYSLSSKVF